ncbi:putative leader peptide [Saccharopolyspora aridisoli]|uniref:putative leader peptide n=1 Tax=Saccharopolyspora aridisoli TaxID=2530385 RepID=UPI0038B5697B
MDVDAEGARTQPGQGRCGEAPVGRSRFAGRWLSRHASTVPPCGWGWSRRFTRGTLRDVGATLPKLLLVARRYVDLRRVASALCPGKV